MPNSTVIGGSGLGKQNRYLGSSVVLVQLLLYVNGDKGLLKTGG